MELSKQSSLFKNGQPGFYAALALLFALGIGFRLLNLTNPPLDFHAWRQLRSAVVARDMFYTWDRGADPTLRLKAQTLSGVERLEPNLTEAAVALVYLVVGSEHLWISRIVTTLFWVIGGLALFALARRMTSNDGALVALAYYLLLPFGNTVSRAFIPEPLMIMWILLACYAAYRWSEAPSWAWAIATGILSGLAILTKVFAVFPLGFAILFLLLASKKLGKLVSDPQTWVMGALAGLIPALYYILPSPSAGGSYLTNWTLPYLHRLTDIWFYISWLNRLNTYFNLAVVLIGAAAILVLPKRARALCLGLWLGYIVTGAMVPSLILSHIYYNLPLVPILALSLAPIGTLLLSNIGRQGRTWQILFLGTALVAIGYSVFLSRKEVTAQDFRSEPARWLALSQKLPADSNIIGLTDDYNMRMRYYGWRFVQQYPQATDQDMARLSGREFDETAENWDYFTARTEGYDFFIITLMDELDKQPYLKNILSNNYPIYDQGEGYIIFDLRQRK